MCFRQLNFLCCRCDISHSMGCAMFFVAMINRPELNDRIEVMMALAPATALAQMKSPIRYFAPFATPLQVCLILHKRIIVISFCVYYLPTGAALYYIVLKMCPSVFCFSYGRSSWGYCERGLFWLGMIWWTGFKRLFAVNRIDTKVYFAKIWFSLWSTMICTTFPR